MESKKKLVIKPFKVKPKVPENFESLTWMKLKEAVICVDKREPLKSMNKEELYQAVEDMCIHNSGTIVYSNLSELCNTLIGARMQALIGQISTDHWRYLNIVEKIWQHHCETNGVLSIWEMGLSHFKKHMTTGAGITDKIMYGLLNAIEIDRQTNAPPLDSSVVMDVSDSSSQLLDYDVMKSVCRMLQCLRMYDSHFEPCLIQDSTRFFTAEGESLLDTLTTSQYLCHVEYRMNQVNQMVNRYLLVESSRYSLIKVVESTLLSPHHTLQLIQEGLPKLLSAHLVDDVCRLYGMVVSLNQSNMLELLRTEWSNYIRLTGGNLLATPTGADSVVIKDPVGEILLLQDKTGEILKKAFRNQDTFRTAYRSSFESFLNAGAPSGNSVSNKVPELLAKYFDKKLRGADRTVSDSEMEVNLDKCLQLFFYINSKDVFEGFYRKYLARRLLLGKSSSTDLEKSIIAKLKAECGPNYPSKLEGMFTDMELSKDVMQNYGQHCTAQGRVVSGLDAHFQVLTMGFWPTSTSHFTTDNPVPSFPKEIRLPQAHFIEFYNSKYQGRRLAWSYSLDRCVVTARFPKGRKELEVSFHQALVLACFNENPMRSFDDVRNMVLLEVNELRRTLISLCNGMVGTRVITKEPKGKDINDTDCFRFNSEFSNKLYHIKINAIQLRETAEESDKVNDEVFRDRQYQADASIVRIMKARKQLPHNQLISELMSQLKYPIKVVDIKKRIESLIERDYLERTADDSNVYSYLA